MSRFHINAAGNPGVCRAKTVDGCPFGGDSEHYSTRQEAREVYETQQELLSLIDVGGGPPLSPAAEFALTAPLGPLEEQPSWMGDYHFRLQEELFGVRPEAIAIIESSIGPLAVVWEAATVDSNDLGSQVEQGYRIGRISYRTMAEGELVGRAKSARMDSDSLEAAYGSDEWRGFRYIEDQENLYGMETEYPEARDYSPDQDADSFPRTRINPPALESREDYVKLVDKAQRHFRDFSEKPVGTMNEVELKEELTRLQGLANERLDSHGRGFATPSIDYIELAHKDLRGQGLGASLYIFLARKHAEQGLPLRASGLQSKEAKKSWARMAADPNLPVRVGNNVYQKSGWSKVEAHYLLDFR